MGISFSAQNSVDRNSPNSIKTKESVKYSVIDAEIGVAIEEIPEIFNSDSFIHEDTDEEKEIISKKNLINSFIHNNLDEFNRHLSDIKGRERKHSIITENNMREVLLNFLFNMPLEKEIFEMLLDKNVIDLYDENDFTYVLQIALNNEEYCNVHHLIFTSVNRKEIYDLNKRKIFVENYLCKMFKSNNTKELDPHKVLNSDRVNKNFKENVLKYVLHFRRIALKKHKDFDKELELVSSKFFGLFVPIMTKKDDKNLIKKFSSYINIRKTKYSIEQSKAVLTADLNILAQEALYKDMKKTLERIIKCSVIDANELTRVHKSERPVQLACYIAERGYVDLLKLFLNRKDFNVIMRDGDELNQSPLYSCCVRGRGYCKYVKVNKTYTVDYDKCIDMIIQHSDFRSVVQHQNVMAEAIRYNYDYASMELMKTFGLKCEFIEELTVKVLHRFLNKRVEETKNGITVDYEFLEKVEEDSGSSKISNKSLHTIKNTDLCKALKHPVLASYIEMKNYRFRNLHSINFVMFLIFFVLSLVVGFVLKSNNYKKTGTVCLFGVAVVYLALREFLQFIFNLMTLKRLEKIPIGPKLIIKSTAYHFDSSSNIAELFLILSTFLSTLTIYVENDFYFRLFFSITILLTTLELSLLLTATFSSTLAIYFFMLKKVAISFARVMIFFFLIILAFSFAFHVVFYMPNHESEKSFSAFAHCWTSVVKTTAMLTGEYEAGDLPFNGWWSETLLMFFVLTAIILFNLINGLAITDIQVLREDADYLNLINKLDNLDTYENLLDDYFQQKPDSDDYALRFVKFMLNHIITKPNDSSTKVLYNVSSRSKSNQELHENVAKIRWFELIKIVKYNAVKSQKQYSEVKMDQISNNVDNMTLQLETNLNLLSGEVTKMKRSVDTNNDDIRDIKMQLVEIKKLLKDIKKKKR